MKIALVHDYLREYGGAERVLEALHEVFPEASLFTAFVDAENLQDHWRKFKHWTIYESWMTKIPGYKRLYSPLRLLAPTFFEWFDLRDYDVVISSSNMYFAKAVRPRKGAVHICYCHTPPRSLYGYSTMTDWQKNPLTKVIGKVINLIIKPKDQVVSQRVDYFIANSNEVRGRIQKFYRRDSTVIYPPVFIPSKLTDQPTNGPTDQPYYLYVNRLAFSKHPELAIQVCSQLNLPLKVVGTGKMLEGLKEMAGSSVEFLGAVSDEELRKLYAGAKALLYPVEDEDFGIVPVEAMGYGVPVIAHRSGGPKETIIENVTGVFIDELTVDSLAQAIENLNTRKWNRSKIHQHAKQFSEDRFKKEIREFVRKRVKTD